MQTEGKKSDIFSEVKLIFNNKCVNNVPSDINVLNSLLGINVSKECQEYIKKFELNNPQKLIKWLIDFHFAAFESINDGIRSVRNDLLTNEVAKIRSVIDKLEDINASDNKSWLLKAYTDNLMDAITNIEGKIENYISEIRYIDNLPSYKFFILANFNKSKVTTAVSLTKASFQAYFEALNIYAVISNERHDLNSHKKERYFEKKLDFIKKQKISLVYAYDKNHDAGFWDSSKLQERLNSIKLVSKNLEKFLCLNECREVDLENDIKY